MTRSISLGTNSIINYYRLVSNKEKKIKKIQNQINQLTKKIKTRVNNSTLSNKNKNNQEKLIKLKELKTRINALNRIEQNKNPQQTLNNSGYSYGLMRDNSKFTRKSYYPELFSIPEHDT